MRWREGRRLEERGVKGREMAEREVEVVAGGPLLPSSQGVGIYDLPQSGCKIQSSCTKTFWYIVL